jgi:hypothetical protein
MSVQETKILITMINETPHMIVNLPRALLDAAQGLTVLVFWPSKTLDYLLKETSKR